MQRTGIVAALAAWLLALSALAGPPQVRVTREAEMSELRVDGTVLRRTATPVADVEAVAGPLGLAAYARWTENGQVWGSVRRGGGDWSAPRRWSFDLRLQDGAVSSREPMPQVPAGLSLGPAGRVFLVQFDSISLPEWRAALRAAGAELLTYFPYHAHLVRVDPQRLADVRALPFVGRVEAFHPAYRLEAPLRTWLESDGGPPTRRVRAQAFEWGSAGKGRIAAAARALGARVDASWPSGHVVELTVTREALRALAGHDDLLWIDGWAAPATDMDLVRQDGGADWLETNLGYCGQGVRGEVMDRGIQADHPDFDGLLAHGASNVDSHGTSTYGIVFANGDRDGDGDPQALGQLACAEQGIFADYDSVADRFAHTQELKAAPYFASFQTNSWGNGQVSGYNTFSQEMDDIIWRLDIAILQSQSNTGGTNSRPEAWAKNVIAVGGIYHEDTLTTADDGWNGGASTGPAQDGRIKPDVSYWYDAIYTTTSGSGYDPSFGGTSAATPQAAGVLGLILQMWSENVWGTNPAGATVFERQPHFSTLKALLINSAEPYPFSGTTADLTRVHQGWGRPNARSAQERAARSLIVDEAHDLELNDAVAFNVDVLPGESELKITMVYPDPPGVTAANLHRINDLNLRVVSPSGDVYHGNVGLDAGNESVAGGLPNDVDTVENVFVPDPEAGSWAIEIEAVEVNQDAVLATPADDATFALVVTGAAGGLCAVPQVDFTISDNPARVGDRVEFSAIVSGGAGGPYSHAWDFDGDGITDSEDAQAAFVYARPYDGEVRLRSRDVANCPGKHVEPMRVDGPDLLYDGLLDLTEVDGNGNGALDPGEVWEMRILLRNDGSETAGGVQARLSDASLAGSAPVLQPGSTFPDIPPGGSLPSDAFYRFKIGDSFVCGQDALFSVAATSADPGNAYPEEPGVAPVLVGGVGPPVQIYADSLESDLGWLETGGGEWEFGAPQGLGGQSSIPGQVAKPDPTAAADGNWVIGTDLNGLGVYPGNYELSVDSTMLSPPMNASGATGVELHLQRWLNTDVGDRATIDVSADGANWTTLFDDPGDHTDTQWVPLSWDISAVADGEPAVQVRFGLVSDALLVQGGWNVDDIRLFGVTKDSCDPFVQTKQGEAIDLRVAPGAAGELQLSWFGDCGGATSFGIYRGDLASGYASIAPEPGRCSVTGTSTSVPEGAGAADFFLVVPNDGAAEGSYGGDSSGAPRPPAGAACFPSSVDLANCAP